MKIKGQETKEALKEIDKILEIANKYRKKKVVFVVIEGIPEKFKEIAQGKRRIIFEKYEDEIREVSLFWTRAKPLCVTIKEGEDYIKRLKEEARKRKWKYYMEIVKDFFFRKRR